jgi:glycerophosphoryl diester phosphodiesterase
MIDALDDFRSSWKELALTSMVFKLIAFVLLTPLVGLLFQVLIAMSGTSVFTDVDILYLFVRPIGLGCVVLFGALWLAIIALEQTSLLGILCAKNLEQRLGVVGALRFTAANAWAVIQVTVRIIVFTLLIIAPFVAVAAVVYSLLLTQYDINYYLSEKPPAFIGALGIGAVMLVALGAILLRLFTGWLFAIPLVLFEGVRPSEALRCSGLRTLGHRRTILFWILGWLLATTILTSVATGIVGAIGHLLVPDVTSSLRLLVIAIGITLMLWAIANLAVNLLSTTAFAAVLFDLYRQLGSNGLAAARMGAAIDSADRPGVRITLVRLVGAGVAGVVIAVTIGAIALQSVRLEDDVAIMAHRGSSSAAPENTMAAFRQAIADGADWIELDVQETADGDVVVFHDSDFMKLAGNKLKIWDATMDDLKNIDIGSRFAPEFKDERVPTLGEVLDECKGKIGVNIELKYYGHDKQLEQRVVDVVESRDMSSEVMAMSLQMDGVKKLKALRPSWKVGLLMSVSAGDVRKIEADFLAINAGFASSSFVRTAHASGKDVYVWTVNDAITTSTMISRGVDGLLTDKPALARAVLEQRAEMSGPERLLIELAALLGASPKIVEQ